MAINVQMSDHVTWASYGLDELAETIDDHAEYRNQREDYCDSLAGDAFAAPDQTVRGPDGTEYRVIVTTTFGNDHSPWTMGTAADLYAVGDEDDDAEYAADLAWYEAMPENLDDDDADADGNDPDDDA